MAEEKLQMHSPNLVQGNIKKIAELFPNTLTEVEDENGNLKQAIDFDILKQELADYIVSGKEERYQFTWPEKRNAILLANSPISETLRPCREESVGKDGTPGGFDSENLYIEGDNLDVLKLLQETYLGKIKMIYIDPPYNTGNDFVYSDDFAEDIDSYLEKSGQFDKNGNKLIQNTESNGRFHTDWLNMIYPRLKLSKNLLSEDGVIFISIDDNEIDNLKKICNEIFGENNLVTEIPWQSRASVQNDTDFSVNHEYICVYAKNRRKENRRLKETNASDWYRKDSFVCRPLPLDMSKFSNPDNDPRGPWKADPFDAPHIRPNLTYPIINPNNGRQHLPPRGRHWRISQEKFANALADNRIVWTNNGEGRPQLKSFYNEKKAFGSVDNSWFSAEKIGTSTNGTKELMSLFDGNAYFDTPKPTSLLSKLITLANVDKGEIILDFFSGSATTADAVLQLNTTTQSNYKFIMVQTNQDNLPDDSAAYKAGYKNICEIGKERIRRAGKKIKEENPLTTQDVDFGFRVLKLDSTNMKDIYYNPAEITQANLDGMIDNIKSDRTQEDLLFQVMIDLGVPLSSKIEETAIAKTQPYFFVMRDSSAAGDSVIANFEQIFKTYSPDTKRKVL